MWHTRVPACHWHINTLISVFLRHFGPLISCASVLCYWFLHKLETFRRAQCPGCIYHVTITILAVLRDYDTMQLTPREYLEIALQPLAGSGRAVEAKNSIRASIKALFPHRDCFALVRPMSDERALANLEAVAPAQMRPEFREVCWVVTMSTSACCTWCKLSRANHLPCKLFCPSQWPGLALVVRWSFRPN